MYNNNNKRNQGSFQKEMYFSLYILNQYYTITCRGEPVPGVGNTSEDQLIKYQWTMKDCQKTESF